MIGIFRTSGLTRRLLAGGFVGLLLASTPSLAATPPRTQPPVATSLSRADAERLFGHGNQLFREALERAKSDKTGAASMFGQAAAAWRTVALSGIHNAGLEKNIANAELLAGDVPRAIAAFRRAQALDPFDDGVRSGLAAARRAAGTENLAPGASPAKETDEAGGVAGTALGIGHALAGAARRTLLYLPERAMLWAAAACYLLAFALAGLRVANVWKAPRWAAAVLLVAASLFVGPLVGRDVAATPQAVVIPAGTIGRGGPADLYDPAFKEPLPAGLEVEVAEHREGWARVRLGDGRSAWVPDSALEPI